MATFTDKQTTATATVAVVSSDTEYSARSIVYDVIDRADLTYAIVPARGAGTIVLAVDNDTDRAVVETSLAAGHAFTVSCGPIQHPLEVVPSWTMLAVDVTVSKARPTDSLIRYEIRYDAVTDDPAAPL